MAQKSLVGSASIYTHLGLVHTEIYFGCRVMREIWCIFELTSVAYNGQTCPSSTCLHWRTI